jgi:hypothetical protein
MPKSVVEAAAERACPMCEEIGFAWPTSLGALGLDAVAEDEGLAAAARSHYRSNEFAILETDQALRSAMGGDERLLAMRTTASIDHGPRSGLSPWSGQLAITTERLVAVEDVPVTLAAFDEIDDVTLATDRVFVALSSGAGFSIQTCHPRLLRVQLAEARVRRIDGQAGASSNKLEALPDDLPRR